MTLRFEPDAEAAPSFVDEWMARYRPWLESTNPHQECYRRSDEQGISVKDACTCPHPDGCDKECCQ